MATVMIDPFDTLGIEPRFDVEQAALEKRYRELSRVVHPDRFAGAGGADRRRALGRAVDINEAYRLVRDPLRRAEALLRRAGHEVSETAQPKASPAMLMEFMELREELAEARASKQLARVAALSAQVERRQDSVLGALREAFGALGDRKLAPGEGEPLAARLGELRYIRRFLDEVSAIEEELADG